jgi:TPR repeat protein
MASRSLHGGLLVAGVVAGLVSAGSILSGLATAEDGEQQYGSGLYQEAISSWRQAAEGGDASAAYRLGVVYMDGTVTAQDYGEARGWYTRAATAGHREAQFDLGTLYDNGLGVPRSVAEALSWYRAAAARGHPLAQYNLAIMYEDGEGVSRDLVEAYKWYILAARRGFVGTERGSRDLLAPRLSAVEIDKGRELAQRFEPIE